MEDVKTALGVVLLVGVVACIIFVGVMTVTTETGSDLVDMGIGAIVLGLIFLGIKAVSGARFGNRGECITYFGLPIGVILLLIGLIKTISGK